MYDNIKCYTELPFNFEQLGIPKIVNYQTKDLDNLLQQYYITKDGKLVLDLIEYSVVPEAQRPYPHASGIQAMIGILSGEFKGKRTIDYHGTINFYDYIQSKEKFIEFKSYWIYGKLDKIELVENRDEE